MGDWTSLARNALYLVALINPASKLSVLSLLSETHSPAELRGMAARSTAAAFLILISLAAAGQFILQDVFHVELYSLKTAGGLVLLYFGAEAIVRGQFFEVKDHANLAEMSIVPLASPMIAGPGAITATIAISSQYGLAHASAAVALAIAANLALMLAAGPLGRWLVRLNLMGPLIRITGLIVAAVAVQMILGGLGDWVAALRKS